MKTKKRKSIRKQVLGIVLLISVMALAVTSIGGLISMLKIRNNSESALIERMEQELRANLAGKSELADSELQKYADYISDFSLYINELYRNPDEYIQKEMRGPLKENAGVFSLQKNVVSELVKEEDIAYEASLLSNVEQVFYPVISRNKDVIISIYAGTEKGLTFAYDTQSDIKPSSPYDCYSRVWYKLAKEKQDIIFSDVYQDSFGRGLTITCAAPFYNENNEFAGVVAMDILITDLYNSVIAMELDGGDDSYAFLVDGNGNIISKSGDEANIYNDSEIEKDIAGKILNNETGVSLSYNTTYYAYTPVKSASWRLCVHMPKSTVLKPVERMENEIVYTIIGFFVMLVIIILTVFLLVHRFADTLTKPLIALGEDAKIIADGNLEHRVSAISDNEIGDLAAQFNSMSESLKKYIDDLTSVTKEKERIGAELNVAKQIQADMLPSIFPPFPNRREFDIYATMTPAKEVGGDFYDFFFADNDHIALVMADVSGKGVPAALFMVTAKTIIKNRTQMGGSPAEILYDVNNQLCENNKAELFVTVWLAIIEISTGKGLAANAGHEYPVIKRKDGDYEIIKKRHSPAVATIENIKFREEEFILYPGDRLYVYTDGVAEATSESDELFGTERMLASLNRNKNSSLRDILHNMKKDIDLFVGNAPQFDDITMLGFDYFGGSSVKELVTEAVDKNLDTVLGFIDAELEAGGASMKTTMQVDIAVEEIFVNIAHYAYETGTGNVTIQLSTQTDPKSVQIRFIDEGKQYNPLEKPDPDISLSAEEREIGGLGIFMVKKNVDDLQYEYSENKNILTMTKNI